MTRTAIFYIKALDKMLGFPFSNISWIWNIVAFSRQDPLSRFWV